MNIELLPCPFCGSEASLVYDTGSDYEQHWSYAVNCNNRDECWVQGRDAKTMEEAAALWNRRPLEEMLQGRIEQLEVMVDMISK